MSRFLSLELDGEGLRQFDAPGIEGGWRCLEVELGDHTYFIDVKKKTPGTHTTPAEEDVMPTHDEVAEVVGCLFIAVNAYRRGEIRRMPRKAEKGGEA